MTFLNFVYFVFTLHQHHYHEGHVMLRILDLLYLFCSLGDEGKKYEQILTEEIAAAHLRANTYTLYVVGRG